MLLVNLCIHTAAMHPTVQYLFLLLLLIPACSNAQEADTQQEALTIRPTSNFDISGNGSAREWETTDWIPLVKRRGSAEYSTRAKLLYSDSGIYGLFSCEDEKITATLKEDFARLWTEDVVEIFFWTDESIALYFEYELSPLNYELPILVPNMNGDFLGWRPWQYEGERKTRHATKIVKDANGKTTEWVAEFFIPYALLKPLQNVPPKKGTEWRMNMYRNDFDRGSTSWSWKPVSRDYHDYEKFGSIRFE